MKEHRLYATTTNVEAIASLSIANYETMAEVIVYPGITIKNNSVYATDAAYKHAAKCIRRANKRFLRRDEPFSIAVLPMIVTTDDHGIEFIHVCVPYTSKNAERIRRVKKGLFIRTSIYERHCEPDIENIATEYVRF